MTQMARVEAPIERTTTPPGRTTDGAGARTTSPSRSPAESRYLNRELSWLEFNARVLALAEDRDAAAARAGEVPRHLQPEPRRVLPGAGLRAAGAARGRRPHHARPTGSTRSSSSARSAAGSTELVAAPGRACSPRTSRPRSSTPASASPTGTTSTTTTEPHLEEVFEERIFPVLTPLAVDPAHPFPYISNLSLNLAVAGARPRRPATSGFARVKVPPLLPRFVALPDGERFVPLEQVIAAHLDALFPGMEVLAHHPFRVTRDADFELEDEAEDLLEAIELVLRRRTQVRRASCASRSTPR